MNQNFDLQAYREVLELPRHIAPALQPLLSRLPSLDSQLIEILQLVASGLSLTSAPYLQLNALFCLLKLLEIGRYPVVAITEHLLPCLLPPAEYSLRFREVTKTSRYFLQRGWPSSTPHVQSLGYHFVTLALQTVLLGAYLKPRGLYRNKEYSDPSEFTKGIQQLKKNGLADESIREIAQQEDFPDKKKLFNRALVDFHINPHSYIDFFMLELEKAFLEGTINKSDILVKSICKIGDVYLSSEALGRLSQILLLHRNYSVKRLALSLLGQFIAWGDLEALLLANYTDCIQILAKNISQRPPQPLDQKNQQKITFQKDLLRFIQIWAECFPTLEAFFVQTGPSPLQQVYRWLKAKGVLFPQNTDVRKVAKATLEKFRVKRQRNRHFMEQLDRHRVEVGTNFQIVRPTLSELNKYYQRSEQRLNQLKTVKNPEELGTQLQCLLLFAQKFQELLESIAQDIEPGEADGLIQRGLELVSRIQCLQPQAEQVLRGRMTLDAFLTSARNRLKQWDGSESRSSLSYRVSSVKVNLWNRAQREGKDNVVVNLDEGDKAVRFKMYSRFNELASKRQGSFVQISQLQINSRPFLTQKLHSHQLMRHFEPAVDHRSKRREKRSRAGIRLSQPTEDQWEAGGNTPRFNSVLEKEDQIVDKIGISELETNQRFVKGIKIYRQAGDGCFDRYLNFLNHTTMVQFLQNSEQEIFCGEGWKITKGAVRLQNKEAQVSYYIQSKTALDTLLWNVSTQPSVKISTKTNKISSQKVEIVVIGELAKIGFEPPTIQFQIPSLPSLTIWLPFSFINFIQLEHESNNSIGSLTWYQKKYFKLGVKSEELGRWLRGMKFSKDNWNGVARLGNWRCRLLMNLTDKGMGIQAAGKQHTGEGLFANFLVCFLVKFLSL